MLNSRSEFNRCPLPRMMCKLGDKTFKKNEAKLETDMAREEIQVSKIRDLIKERNRQRAETNRIKQKPPAAKRRKLDEKKEQRNTQDLPDKKRERLTRNWRHSQQRGEKCTMTSDTYWHLRPARTSLSPHKTQKNPNRMSRATH